jgi:hypothetical protein
MAQMFCDEFIIPTHLKTRNLVLASSTVAVNNEGEFVTVVDEQH